MGRSGSQNRRREECFKFLTGKGPLGRFRRRWEDNIRKDIEEIGINARNRVDSAQDKDYWRIFLNTALNLLVT